MRRSRVASGGALTLDAAFLIFAGFFSLSRSSVDLDMVRPPRSFLAKHGLVETDRGLCIRVDAAGTVYVDRQPVAAAEAASRLGDAKFVQLVADRRAPAALVYNLAATLPVPAYMVTVIEED